VGRGELAEAEVAAERRESGADGYELGDGVARSLVQDATA
jgi:hypothetical protein